MVPTGPGILEKYGNLEMSSPGPGKVIKNEILIQNRENDLKLREF